MTDVKNYYAPLDHKFSRAVENALDHLKPGTIVKNVNADNPRLQTICISSPSEALMLVLIKDCLSGDTPEFFIKMADTDHVQPTMCAIDAQVFHKAESILKQNREKEEEARKSERERKTRSIIIEALYKLSNPIPPHLMMTPDA